MDDFVRLNSISQVHKTVGLPKPSHPMVSVIRLTEGIDTSDIPNIPFVMDLYQVSLKECAPGSFRYGRNQYDFQEGTLVFSKPGQVMDFDHVDDDVFANEGWSLIFHPDLIRKSELGKTINQYSFFSYEANEALHLSDQEKSSLSDILKNIENEISRSIDQYSQELIASNIKLLLDYCKRYYDRQFYTRTNLNQDHATTFDRLLEEYYAADKPLKLGIPTVTWCGKQMGLSPNYLSDLLKK